MKRLVTLTILLLAVNFYAYGSEGKTIDELQSEGKTIEEIQKENEKDEAKRSKTSDTKHSEKKPKPVEAIKDVPPFNSTVSSNINILEIDPNIVGKYNEAVEIEKNFKQNKHDPLSVIAAWTDLLKLKSENPFISIAKERLQLWLGFSKYLRSVIEKREKALKNISKMLQLDSIGFKQKVKAVTLFIEEYGVSEGLDSMYKTLLESEGKETGKKILQVSSIDGLIKTTIKKRCDSGAVEECYNYSKFFQKGDKENLIYLDKACSLKHDAACKEVKALRKEIEEKRIKEEAEKSAALEKKRKEEEKQRALNAKIERELSEAGGKKRKILATTALLSGIAFGAAGVVLFTRIPVAEEKRDDAYQEYLSATNSNDANKYRKDVEDYKREKLLYGVFGGIGAGLGLIGITTGIILYSINSEGEKTVKKKYNISFNANPLNRMIGLTIRY